MTEVSVADIAQDFGSDHSIAVICSFSDMCGINGFEITGPAASRIKFGVRFEKRRFTADALIDAVFVMIPVLAGEGALRASVSCHLVRHRLEQGTPFGIGTHNFFNIHCLLQHGLG